jgi:hypothetical protein
LEPQVTERLDIYNFHGSDARLRKIEAIQTLGFARPNQANQLKISLSKLFSKCADDELRLRAGKLIVASCSAIFQAPRQKTPTHPRKLSQGIS